jgi:hypothetical protein
MAKDAIDGTIYSANWDAGVFRLQSGGPQQTPGPTSTATPVASATATVTQQPTNTSAPTNTSVPTNTPTRTPTPRPTNTPAPTNTPIPPSFSASATPSSAVVVAGTSVTITSSVRSVTAATALVDVEVFDGTGKRVFQQRWDNESFAAAQTRTFTSSWTPPLTSLPGSYTIRVGVFTPGGGSQYYWNANAGNFTVA